MRGCIPCIQAAGSFAVRLGSHQRRTTEGRLLTQPLDARLQALLPVVRGLAEMFGPDCEVVLHDVRRLPHSIVAIENGAVTGRTARRRAHRPHAPQPAEPGRDPGRAPVHLVARRQDPQVAGRHPEGRGRRAVRPARPQPRHLRGRAGPAHARQLHRRRPPRRRRRARGGRDLRRRHPRRGRRHGHPDRRRDGQDSRRHVARGEDGGRQAPRGARCVPRQALRGADRRGARPLALHDLRVPQGDPARGRRRDGGATTAQPPQPDRPSCPRRAAGGKR